MKSSGKKNAWQKAAPLACLLAGLIGCSSGGSGDGKNFTGGPAHQVITQDKINTQIDQIIRPQNKSAKDQIMGTSFKAFLQYSLKNSTDDTMDYAGHSFIGMRTFLDEHETELIDLGDSYDLVSDYLAAFGIFDLADIDRDMIDKGLTYADKIMNQNYLGKLEQKIAAAKSKTNSGSPSDGNSYVDTNVDTTVTALYLSTAGLPPECVNAAIGLAAGTVGSGIACSKTIGVSCGAGVAIVAAGAKATVQNCEGLGQTKKSYSGENTQLHPDKILNPDANVESQIQ